MTKKDVYYNLLDIVDYKPGSSGLSFYDFLVKFLACNNTIIKQSSVIRFIVKVNMPSISYFKDAVNQSEYASSIKTSMDRIESTNLYMYQYRLCTDELRNMAVDFSNEEDIKLLLKHIERYKIWTHDNDYSKIDVQMSKIFFSPIVGVSISYVNGETVIDIDSTLSFIYKHILSAAITNRDYFRSLASNSCNRHKTILSDAIFKIFSNDSEINDYIKYISNRDYLDSNV